MLAIKKNGNLIQEAYDFIKHLTVSVTNARI